MANGNPRLEVEIAVSGLGKATKDFGTLQKELQNTSKEFSKANATALELEGELKSLSSSLARGAISQDKYDKEVREVSVALASARQAAQQYQSRINSLNATIAQGANAGRQYGNAVGSLQGVHDSVSKGIRGATSVSVELGRALSDLPYGIQGVANNIQQLTTNLGYYTRNVRESLIEQGKQASTMNVLKSALGGLLSPMGLVSIGVSALTAGWVLYDKWQQKSKKSIDETKKSLTAYIDTLNGVARAQANGQVNALKELTTIEQLYKATQNVNLPMKDRIENAKELIKQGGELFKSTTAEAVVAGKASEAYDKLSNSIRHTAMAQAYMQRMTENATKVLNNNLNILNEANEILKLNQQIARQESITTAGQAVGAGSEAMESANVRTLNSLYEKRQERINNINNLNKENAGVLKEQNLLQKGINTSIENGGKIVDSTNSKLKENNKQLKNYLQQVRDIGQKAQFSLDIASSVGLDKELERNRQKYKSYLDELDRIEKQNRGKNVENARQTQIEINNVRKQIIANQALEEQQIRLKYERETQDLITSILNDAGLSRIKSRQQELDANKKYYDELANKHRENAQILQAITEARKASENAINEKWDKKAYDDAERLYAKVGKLEDKAFTGKTQEALKKQLDERLKQIEDFYKNIAKILEAAGVDTSGAYTNMLNSFDKVYNQFESASSSISDGLSKEVKKGITRGIGSAFSDLYNSIDNLGSNFYQVFTNVFQRLSGYVGNVMSDVIGRYLGEKLSDKIDAGEFKLGGLSAEISTALVAGASLAGKVLGGMISRESTVGQGVAGAISGAAAGAATGTAIGAAGGPIGAVIGGVVGLIGGIFSAKEAKRQRELQEQQLAEQRKQTALMERQALLAYSARIIGQMTNQGVVTAIERDAHGELVARVSGKDIELVLERTRSGRG